MTNEEQAEVRADYPDAYRVWEDRVAEMKVAARVKMLLGIYARMPFEEMMREISEEIKFFHEGEPK